jgi:hypothetical protein
MQTVIVILIVVAALFFAVRRLVRILKRKEGCGCGCDHCPMKDGKDCHCSPRLPDIKV